MMQDMDSIKQRDERSVAQGIRALDNIGDPDGSAVIKGLEHQAVEILCLKP